MSRSRVLILVCVSACSGVEAIEFEFPAGKQGSQILIVTNTNDGRVSAFASALDRDTYQVPFDFSAGELLHLDAVIYAETLGELGVAEGELLANAELGAHRMIPAEVFSLDIAGGAAGAWSRREGALPGSLSKFLPLDPIANEVCRIPQLGEMKPFAMYSPVALPPQSADSNRYRDFEAVRFVDRTRAMIRTTRMLMLIERDREFQLVEATRETDGNMLDVDRLARPDAGASFFTGLIADPRPLLDGRRRMIALVSDHEEGTTERVYRGWLYALSIGPRGIEDIEDLAMVSGEAVGMAIDEEGNIGVVAENGTFHVIARDGTISRLPEIPMDSGEVHPYSVTWTKDQDRPWAVAGLAAIHLYDARAQRWESSLIATEWFPEEVFEGRERRIWIRGIAAATTGTGELDLWAVGGKAAILRKLGDGAWTPVYPVLPPRYAPCANEMTSPYPSLSFGGRLNDVLVDGDHVHVSLGCNAALQLRRSDQCAALTTVEVEPVSATGPRVWAIDLLDGELIAAGESGRLLRARR